MNLQTVMDREASKSVGVLVAAGDYLLSSEAGSVFTDIITLVEQRLPRAPHRLLVSYSWLMLATFKVCIN